MTVRNLESFDGEDCFEWLPFYMGKISWKNFIKIGTLQLIYYNYNDF